MRADRLISLILCLTISAPLSGDGGPPAVLAGDINMNDLDASEAGGGPRT